MTASESQGLSHIDERGRATMVDVGGKPIVQRVAVAEGFLRASEATIDAVVSGELPKGEALAVARIAGISAAKRCDELIPLCHTLPLDQVAIDIARSGSDRLRIEATARTSARTGVEMEALTAVSVTALTLYDMMKAIDRAMVIEDVRLLSKSKGTAQAPAGE